MRELDPQTSRCAVIGAGRLGSAVAPGLRAAGVDVEGPLARGAVPSAPVVLLCVPDGQIAAAAAALPAGRIVGHCSGATGLEPLAPHEAFSLHPLVSVPHGADFRVLRGAGCALDAATPRALRVAAWLARALGLEATRVAPEDRTAYHAAASVAANFLVTLEGAAETLAASAGVERRLLAPLVRAAAEQWAQLGAERALTGPIARGDEATVARQREAVQARAPELLPLWDALADATRALAGRTVPSR